MSLVIAAFTIVGAQAQENKTIKEETTVKRIVTKDGSNVKVKEIKSTATESGAVIVEGNNKVDQESTVRMSKDLSNEVLMDDVDIDKDNESSVAKQIEIQNAELETSRRNQQELAARKNQEYKDKQDQMKKEMAERRESLQARPKGMSKLKN